MKNNVKNIISEAFDEIFEEMMNEDGVYTKKGMTSDQVDGTVQKALRRGYDPKLAFDFETGSEQQNNFNVAIDMLLDAYINSEDETEKLNAKKAIQTAFSPSNKKLKNMFGTYMKNNPSFEDIFSDSWEHVFINNFDGLVKLYKGNVGSGTFGGIVYRSLENRIKTLMKRGSGEIQDVTRGGSDQKTKHGISTKSMDDSINDGGGTYGEKIASSPYEKFRDLKIKGLSSDDALEVYRYMIDWVEEQVDNPEYKISPVQAIVFKEIMLGQTPLEIWHEHPEVREFFGFETDRNGDFILNKKGEKKINYKPINMMFKRLTSSKIGRDLSYMISSAYNIDFNLSNIDPVGIRQVKSQNPEFGTEPERSRFNEKSSEKMLEIRSDIKDILDEFGYKVTYDGKIDTLNKDGEFEKFKNIFKDLEKRGRNDVILELSKLIEQHAEAREYDKASGGYGAISTELPSKADHESNEFGGLYERISKSELNRLYERVMRRISR